MKRILRIGAVLLLATTATAACGDDDSGGDDNVAVDETTTTTMASTANGDATKLELVASEITFNKASLSAKAGQPVTITLTNNDSVEHNITVEDLDVDKDVEGGESETTDPFTPTAGTYEYHCEYHPSAMKGTLTVS